MHPNTIARRYLKALQTGCKWCIRRHPDTKTIECNPMGNPLSLSPYTILVCILSMERQEANGWLIEFTKDKVTTY
jgi:hypothetical protein